ncbi:hypothetical protein TUM19329_25520 [Legionella antarctica]|uniref:Ankyrin repeat-containing protein n=1 Tax=Legionella antarctica TaxID=2708020 RepID=A0A6F8T6W5_9GAMM|nr:hypothetical protein [Legionella antarctica]BCA96191.1 hypothetical protein TUM19329_25520 [Legionella antarctica]
MPLKRYILIPDLSTFYNDAGCATKIAQIIERAILRKEYLVYPSLERANRDKSFDLKKQMATAGIMELEIEAEGDLNEKNTLKFCKEIQGLRSDKEKAKKCSLFIKNVYVKGFKLPFDELGMRDREVAQISSFSLVEDSKLQLNKPPLLYLKQIPDELLFMLFTDHQHFLNFENWRHYNAREPNGNGCIYDLFQTTTFLCNRFPLTLNHFTLEHIQTVQKLLSDSVFFGSTEDRRGLFRTSYNAFSLSSDAVTIDGIKELLQRIKNDNEATGFRIGPVKRSNVVATFCWNMYSIIQEEKPWKQYFDAAGELTNEMIIKIEEFENRAIRETCKEKEIAYKDVKRIVKDFLENFKPDKKVARSQFWGNLSYYYCDSARKFSRRSTKMELQYDLIHARANAVAAAGNIESSAINIKECTGPELETLAKTIYARIQNSNDISLCTPEPKLAEKWANVALKKYQNTIGLAKCPMEIIEIIDELVHELEILHLFPDVNCRTNYLLMNFLFMTHSLRWSIEFNPNRLDAYSKKERVQQHIQGMLRTDYIIEHQEQLLEDNKRIDLIYLGNKEGLQTVDYSAEELSQVNVDTQYREISQQLVETLEEYEKTFKQNLETILKKYDLQSQSRLCSTSAMLFPIPAGYMEFSKALKQLQANYDGLFFFKSVAHLNTVPEIAEDIETLMNLSGFNKCWMENNGVDQSADSHFR